MNISAPHFKNSAMRSSRARWIAVLAAISVLATMSVATASSSKPKLVTPKNIKAAPGNGVLSLTWDKVPGADNYTVRWGTNGKYTNYSNDRAGIHNPTTNAYVITGLTNGTTYNISLAARDTKLKSPKGDYSSDIQSTPGNLKLANVSGIVAVPGNGTLSLTWNQVPGADNYTVRWGTNGKYTNYSNDRAGIHNPTTNAYVITGLTNGTTYNISLAARDTKLKSPKGDYSPATFATPKSTVVPVTSTTLPPATTTTKPTQTVTGQFIDNFDGNAVNIANWKPYFNNYGSGNHELQCLTPNNATVSNGTLKIQAKRETIECSHFGKYNFTSAFLGSRDVSKYYPRYGTFEMRAKLPHGHANWPGFWLRHRNGATSTNGAEVDVMEYFHSQVPGKTTSTLHLAGQKNTYKKTTFFETPTTQPGWHTWAVSIFPVSNGVKFQFLIDGNDAGSYVDQNATAWSTTAPADGTWDMAVNMSIGGDWTGNPDGDLTKLGNGRCAQSDCGSTGVMRTVFPVQYEIDYVRYTPIGG